MDIYRMARLPNGAHVARLSVMMMLRSLWHIVSGQRYRRAQEWKQAVDRAERIRKNRSAGARRGWETRKRNAEIARALDAYDATITATTTDFPNGTTTTYAHPEGITLTSDIEGAPV